MPSRVLAVVIALLITTPLFPQCNFNPVLSDPFRSSVLDLAVDGNDLWAATSYGLALYDRSVDPPHLASIVAVPGTTRLVRLGNGLAYAASSNAIAVVRKNGRTLQLIRTVDTGAQVNDIVVTPLALFVATANGIAQYSLTDTTNPATPIQITQTAATSLALVGSTLYAVDGDTTVEVFNISPVVQHTGSIAVPVNATAVHANNGKLFVSTPIQTYVVIGTDPVGTVPFSLTSIAPVSGDVVFAGSTDRTLRAVDFSTAGAPVTLFRADVPPSGGTINRVTSVVVAGGRVYAGAGDGGIVDFDISAFSAPFPMRSAAFPGASSVFSFGDNDNFYAGTANGVTEFSQGLLQKRSWDGGHSDVVRDGDNGFVLTSSGASMTLWALGNSPLSVPAPVATATFQAPVVSAALFGTLGDAVLSDNTLWSADFSQAVPKPALTAGTSANSIARSGRAAALSQNRSDGSTAITYLTDPVNSAPKSTQVPGLSTVPVTLSGATAAVQTFRGISLIDFSGDPSITVLPQSNDVIARQLLLSGTTLLELTDSTLRVWNTQTQTMTAEVTLPDSPLAVHMAPQSSIADVVTQSGVVTVAIGALGHLPAIVPAPNGNAFYKKLIASPTRIALVDARGVDLFTNSMQYAGSIRTAGIVDVAASDSAVYTLSANLTVNAYSPAGTPIGSTTIDQGADAQALSIAAVNGAIWVSVGVQCTSFACKEKKTLIFDSKLSQMIPMTGAIVDLVSSGNRAYAITDAPAEIRILGVADPTHPSIVSSTSSDGSPTSVAYANGTIYALGNGLASYSESSLTKTADIFTGTSNPDEHIRIDGNCAIVTGRDASPQLFTLPQFAPATAFATPSTARNIASQPGAFYILTDHSLEIWSTAPLPKPPRVHPAR